MFAHIKKFWKVLVGSYLLGLVLTILMDVPWQFIVTLAVFVYILNTVVEQAKAIGGASFDAMKKFFLIGVGVTAFVGVRAVVGYLLDMPAGQAYNDTVTSGGGLRGIASQRLTANIVFELLFLIPGYGIAKMLTGSGGKFSRGVLALVGVLLLAWVVWTIKQPPHAQAIRIQTQARVALDARSRTHNALANTAAALSSYGVAKESVAVFYQLDGGTNLVKDPSLTNRVLAVGEQVMRPDPEEPPFFFQGMTFINVVLKSTDGSFLGGSNAWVEVRQFNWIDGGKITAPSFTTQLPRNLAWQRWEVKPTTNSVVRAYNGDEFIYKSPLAFKISESGGIDHLHNSSANPGEVRSFRFYDLPAEGREIKILPADGTNVFWLDFRIENGRTL